MTQNESGYPAGVIIQSDFSPRGLKAARRAALARAREFFSASRFGETCHVRDDSVVYTVERDGIRRLEKSSEGRTLRELKIAS